MAKSNSNLKKKNESTDDKTIKNEVLKTDEVIDAKSDSPKDGKKSNKRKKIVRYNKKSIIIGGSLAVALIIGGTVGIYYALIPQPFPYPDQLVQTSDWELVRNNIREDFTNETASEVTVVMTGLDTNDDYIRSIYGEKDSDGNYDFTTIDGVYSQFLENNSSSPTDVLSRYFLTASTEAILLENINKLFLGDDDIVSPIMAGAIGADPELQPQGDESYYYLGEVVNDYGVDDWASLEENEELKFSWLQKDPDNVDSINSVQWQTYSPSQTVTWFWFYEGDLTYISSGIPPLDGEGNPPEAGSYSYQYFEDILNHLYN